MAARLQQLDVLGSESRLIALVRVGLGLFEPPCEPVGIEQRTGRSQRGELNS